MKLQINCWHLRLVFLLILFSCKGEKKSEVLWIRDLPVIGSQSSPRAADLNGDRILDIVIGAGRNEYEKTNRGILAFNGQTGETLWQQSSEDQVYGAASFLDVTSDGTPDVFIGGRGPHLKALNGRNGEVLWEYQVSKQTHPRLKNARFNFNNCLVVPDQDGDGLQDILAVNGGNSLADPYSEVNRFAAAMMIINSKTGTVISADTMPDGRESYMSPIMFKQPKDNDYTIVFGTGGETMDGNLYKVFLGDIRNERLDNATRLATEKGHGFIAPATAVDIDGDGSFEIAAISHGSTIFVINGQTSNIMWQRNVPQTESSNSLAVGHFNGDEVPDFFTFVSKGQWPNSTGSVQIMLDGKDGNIAYADSIGCTGYSSPVVYDLNEDGIDEVIISVNEFDCSLGFAGKNPSEMTNRLITIDFSDKSVQVLDELRGFKNIFSTPWIGDLDGDGYLDMIECQYFNQGMLLSFLGMRIKRINTGVPLKKSVTWGSYMGSDGDGWYKE